MDISELSESLQGYLEVILELEGLKKVARAKDIADRLDIQRGSVTAALKSLEEKGLIHYQPYSFITLTDSGKTVAEEIAHRHRVLKDFLLNVLQIDEPRNVFAHPLRSRLFVVATQRLAGVAPRQAGGLIGTNQQVLPLGHGHFPGAAYAPFV